MSVRCCREHDSRKVAWENEQKRSKKTDAQLSELKIKRDAAKVALDVAKELHVRDNALPSSSAHCAHAWPRLHARAHC